MLLQEHPGGASAVAGALSAMTHSWRGPGSSRAQRASAQLLNLEDAAKLALALADLQLQPEVGRRDARGSWALQHTRNS